MNARTSRILLVVSAFLGGLVVFLGIVMFVAGRGPGVASVSAIGGPFTLIDQNGKAITDQNMKGKPFLVFFGYTHCPDVCPTTLFEVSEVMRALGQDANRTSALFITVDPERDTPAVMKDYLSSFDPHLRGVTGTAAAIGAAERSYRVYAKKVPEKSGEYSMDHSAVVYLMDKEGHFVAPFNLKRKPEAAAADLRKYM
ncbi:MAG: SCO family protein [Pseudolabrys sp.]|jgi:protein SCO1/2